jgi:hypothetical protein
MAIRLLITRIVVEIGEVKGFGGGIVSVGHCQLHEEFQSIVHFRGRDDRPDDHHQL